MTVLQPAWLEAYSQITVKFSPSQLISYIVVIIIAIAVIIFIGRTFLTTHKRNQNIKRAKGMILCEFTPATGGGQVYRVLCAEEKGEIRKVDIKEHGSFETDSFIRSPKKLPSESMVEEYLLLPEHDYLDVFPYGVSPSEQIPIRKYYFNENDPNPKMPHDPKKWDIQRYTNVSAVMMRASKDSSDLKGILGEVSGMMQHFYDALDSLKKMKWVFYTVLAVLFIQLLNIFMSFQSMRLAEKAIKFITGS